MIEIDIAGRRIFDKIDGSNFCTFKYNDKIRRRNNGGGSDGSDGGNGNGSNGNGGNGSNGNGNNGNGGNDGNDGNDGNGNNGNGNNGNGGNNYTLINSVILTTCDFVGSSKAKFKHTFPTGVTLQVATKDKDDDTELEFVDVINTVEDSPLEKDVEYFVGVTLKEIVIFNVILDDELFTTIELDVDGVEVIPTVILGDDNCLPFIQVNLPKLIHSIMLGSEPIYSNPSLSVVAVNTHEVLPTLREAGAEPIIFSTAPIMIPLDELLKYEYVYVYTICGRTLKLEIDTAREYYRLIGYYDTVYSVVTEADYKIEIGETELSSKFIDCDNHNLFNPAHYRVKDVDNSTITPNVLDDVITDDLRFSITATNGGEEPIVIPIQCEIEERLGDTHDTNIIPLTVLPFTGLDSLMNFGNKFDEDTNTWYSHIYGLYMKNLVDASEYGWWDLNYLVDEISFSWTRKLQLDYLVDFTHLPTMNSKFSDKGNVTEGSILKVDEDVFVATSVAEHQSWIKVSFNYMDYMKDIILTKDEAVDAKNALGLTTSRVTTLDDGTAVYGGEFNIPVIYNYDVNQFPIITVNQYAVNGDEYMIDVENVPTIIDIPNSTEMSDLYNGYPIKLTRPYHILHFRLGTRGSEFVIHNGIITGVNQWVE
jgi:hypothetical protein